MQMEAHLPVLQVVVPMLLAPVVVLLRPRGLAWAAATAGSLVSLAIAAFLVAGIRAGESYRYALGGWEPPFGIELQVDAFSALILLLVTGSSVFALLAGKTSLDRVIEDRRQPLFYSAWLLVLAGLAGIVVSADRIGAHCRRCSST